ncbi:MAG: DUF4296 domain-containing protein [Flammeovirgaceae bacterium]
MTNFLTFSVVVLLVACGSRDSKPAPVLPREKLINLIIEMYLAEAKMDATSLSRDSTIKFFVPREKKILQKLGIADSTLKITYDYYLRHPKEFEEVYDAVIDSLNLQEQKIK